MIYLDYNATTPIDKRVIDVMQEIMTKHFGNPSSSHELGQFTKKVVEDSRKKVASLFNCSSDEIIFTSGGSESNNMVIKGVAYTFRNKGNHIITTRTEHPAILNPLKFLEQNGYEVTYLPVDEYGIVSVSDIKNAITDKTILITVMHANNETGTIQPIEEIAEICVKNNILFHTDASQSIGKIPIDIKKIGVDFLTIAGHKLYAPKGVGALYIREGLNIEPLIHGAGHEFGKRAGTENIIFDVGLGKACEIVNDDFKNRKNNAIKELTKYFYDSLIENFGEKIKLNGHSTKRLPNTLNISFLEHNALEIIRELKNVAVSTGSACHSGLTTISPVLDAMGVSKEIGSGAIRFSLGRFTTKNEIDTVVEKLKKIILF
ncbi:cysteine desulfurase family protein [Clostridium sediminicola]|uniref:cysteine desulfurase family protein n=1 Tax=Clostridium sediminicola TaxID=3114879 RepID=UPI0031F22ECF